MTQKKILLVEDNADDADLTLRALKKNKIMNEVVVAKDGLDALAFLFSATEPRELPGIVLLDLRLPGVDGLEILRRIRADERTRLLPVIILTTSREQEDLLGGYRNGCNSYIRKPVDFSEFLVAVQQIGAYWLALNESPA
jgi:two-component system response regulator